MDEPVSLVLDFLRQHNFGKAEEALRLELHSRHSLARGINSEEKVEVAIQGGELTDDKDCQGNSVPIVEKTAFEIPLVKRDFDSLKSSGTMDNQMHAYTEWEFKSCINNDCVLEFKKQDARLRRLSLEVPSSNVRQNGLKPMHSIHAENGIGIGNGHAYKNGDLLFNSENGTAVVLALSQNQQHDFELTSDHLLRMNACNSGQHQQNLVACELQNCSCINEPMPVLRKGVDELKAISPRSNVPHYAMSGYHSFSDANWLDHGVLDDDALKSSRVSQPSLYPLPTSEVYEQLEEKRVVHDCIDYIKALTLENQTYPPDLVKDISLPWEMVVQNHYIEGECLNERHTENCYNVPSAKLRSNSGSFSITKRSSGSFDLDKLHMNALFEPAFNLGSFLNIPVGQGITSPGETHENGICQLSCSQNATQGSPELLSGFAILGDEPADPGMGYSKEYWDSDMYEDDEDPGYERREIEDEDWFLAHEIIYPNEDDKVKMMKEKIGEDLLSQSYEGSEMVEGKEDSFLYTGVPLNTGVSDWSRAQPDLDISRITTFFGDSSAGDALTLKQFENMSYDGHLMDAEELKFMRMEPNWLAFSSQFDKHVHYEVDEAEAYDNLHGDYQSETYSRSHTQMKKKATHGSKLGRNSLHATKGQSDDGIDHHDHQETHGAEAFRNANGIQKPLEVDFMSAAVEEARDIPHVCNDGDVFPCAMTFNMKGVNEYKQASSGCFFSSPASNDDLSAVNLDSGCPPRSLESVSSQGRHSEILKSEDNVTLWKQDSGELSPVQASENGTRSNSVLFSHPKDSSLMNFRSEARNEGTTYESGVAVRDDGETSTVQEEAELVKTEEDEYEVFNLRIIHRKNRTGFEEEKHFQVLLNSVVAGRYLITEYLGSAAFSKAVQARDLETGMDVCMKIIKNNKDFFDQSLDEIKLLKYINKNDPADKHHLLRLYDYFYHKEHLFIVCELLRANLYEFHKFNIESGGEPYFTMSRLQLITRQCLEALDFLHCLGLIHCDLKPENILIKSYSRCEIKVIDLGSSCFQTDHLCSYVQSRSYRAPEVILGLPYDHKIDIWSLGCILAELCSGNVLFQNDSLATLLARVIGIIEPIMPDMILKGKEAHKYFTKKSILYERNHDTNKLEYLIPKKSSLRHRLPSGDQGFVDFVGYLLQVNPENRPSASEALKHPWLTHPYEPVCE